MKTIRERSEFSRERTELVAVSIPIGYAVVGLGSIAETAVLPAFRSAKKSKLVALVSHDKSRAQQLGAKFGVKHCYSYGNYNDSLQTPAVDAVFLPWSTAPHAK